MAGTTTVTGAAGPDGLSGGRTPPQADARELLRGRYEAYCVQQAAALPSLLPREGLRALYRDARAAHGGPVDDPLALLLERCRALLPLPPFELWVEDYLAHRAAHLEEAAPDAGARPRAEPVTVELRTLEHAGGSWYAALSLFHAPPSWRGFVTFHAGAGGAPHRTADVFREDSSEAVRERFRSFTPDSLRALLRSVLP